MKLFSKKKKPVNLIKAFDPESPGIIEIQRLFKTIYGKGPSSSGLRSLMVTSTMPQEGKSILSGNLGLVAAQANQHTLIIDADMRRPTQHRHFPVSPSPGLSDYLLKEVELDQAIHNTTLEHLKLLPCGSRVTAPGGLLQSDISEFKALLDQCYMHFDIVIVDVPPVVPVNDAELIAPLADGVAFVVMSGKTYRELVQRGLELLQKSHCNIVGIILNNMKRALPYHYEHKYYHYRPGPVWSGD